MVTPKQIAEYLQKVPPLPDALKKTLAALEAGDLAGAAKEAAQEQAMIYYLRRTVNSAAFGFRNELKEVPQIFSALGIQRAKQLLYAYMVSVTAPEKWGYFDLSSEDFARFQVEMMSKWQALLEALEGEERFLSAAALVTAGLVVADAIFADRKQDVELLTSMEDLPLDTILERVSGMRFGALVNEIAKKWEADADVAEVVALALSAGPCDASELTCRLAKALHLLLFYELSRPAMMKAGANGFVPFDPAFVEEVYETFAQKVELA